MSDSLITRKLAKAQIKKDRLVRKQTNLRLKLNRVTAKVDGLSLKITRLITERRLEAQNANNASLTVIPLEVRTGMRPTGQFYGLIVRVAKQLGVNRSSVADAVAGRMVSARIVDGLTSEIQRIRKTYLPPLTPKQRDEMERGGKYYGLTTEVCRILGCTRNTVHAVATGNSWNQPILAELQKRMGKRDVLAVSPLLPRLTPEQMRHFRYGGKYHGLYTVAAKRVGCNKDTVSWNARKGMYSNKGLTELYEEMARVDAELAAKQGGAK